MKESAVYADSFLLVSYKAFNRLLAGFWVWYRLTLGMLFVCFLRHSVGFERWLGSISSYCNITVVFYLVLLGFVIYLLLYNYLFTLYYTMYTFAICLYFNMPYIIGLLHNSYFTVLWNREQKGLVGGGKIKCNSLRLFFWQVIEFKGMNWRVHKLCLTVFVIFVTPSKVLYFI